MTDGENSVPAEPEWERERQRIQANFSLKLRVLPFTEAFSFVSFSESDNIMLSSDSWPKDKWDLELYLQSPLDVLGPIELILKRFMELTEEKYLYLFFMHFNFGLVQMSKDTITKYLKELIDIDGDEILFFLPQRPEFICIEKTEVALSGEKEFRWVYELTFSNLRLKDELLK